REHHTLYGELLYTVQEHFSSCAIALHRLLLAQRINIRIAPRSKGPLRTDEGFGAGGRIARGPRGDYGESPELLLTPGGKKGRPLHGLHTHPNTDSPQGVQNRLTNRKKGRNGGQLPSIKTIRIACFGKELLGFLDLVGQRLGWQGILHDPRHNDSSRRTKTEACHFIDRLAF